MAGKKKGTYVARPQPGKQAHARLEVMKEVLAGRKTVTEAAGELGLSRHRFQVLMNRSLQAMVAELEPGAPGRPRKPEREAKLEAETERLRKENARMKERVNNIDRLLILATETLKGRIAEATPPTKPTRPTGNPSTSSSSTGDDEDPEPDPRVARQLEQVMGMRQLGLTLNLAAAVAGISPSTVRRWLARRRQGASLCRRRGPGPRSVAPAVALQAALIVRQLEGLIGAQALAVATGLSRRKAAGVKHDTLIAMERERQAACARVTVTVPGIMRGFDQMYVWTNEGWRYLLIAADAAVPYRTSVLVTAAYDEESVLAALEHDIKRHGAPLVYRLDRASAHRTPRVQALLSAAKVLVLHGPPRCPRYYGQLERQNREHREWLSAAAEARSSAGGLAAAALPALAHQMLDVMNTRWPRRALGFRTAAEPWAARPVVDASERWAFLKEAIETAENLTRDLNYNRDSAMRLAIEQALQQRGYLRQQRGLGAN